MTASLSWRETLFHPFSRLRASSLCRRDIPIHSAREAIGWWETRRIPFNLIVGIAGIISTVVVCVVGLGGYFLFDGDFAIPPPLFAAFEVLLYGIAANVFFTGGWLAELIVRKIWPIEADRFATLSFSLGLIFSVVLTLTPAIVFGAAGIFGLVGHLLRVSHSHPL
jgi:ABC-type branched-subunit amino acid transport system permease subunit